MKTKALLVCLAASMVLTFTNCAKEGCTDSEGENYASSAKKDDGSCTYKAQFVFCWAQAFHDSAVVHGVSSVAIYVNSAYVGTLPVSGQVFTAVPSCGTSGALTITEEFAPTPLSTVFEPKNIPLGYR